MIPFVGYAPDIDPQTPGVLTDVVDMVPTAKGVRVRSSPVDAGYSAFPAEVRGLAVTKTLDGSNRIFSGTTAKLYELAAGVTTDRSRVGDYSLGADVRWNFAQFGNTTIAAADQITLQYADSGNDFADISGAPKAKLVTTAAGFVMAACTNDTTFGDQQDRWWCSAYQDYSDWTPSIQTQSASGRLIDSPGPIRALKSLGDNVIAYKEKSIFVGTYVGGDTIWQWSQIPGDYGVQGNEAVITTGYSHFFLGFDDFYQFDGTRAVPIGTPIRETFFSRVSIKFIYKTIGAYDRANGIVWWFYVSSASSSGAIDEAVCYNIKYNKWGKARLNIESAAEYISGGVTYNGLGTEYTTWDDLPTGLAYNSPYWTAETPIIAFVDTSHTLQTLTGEPTTGSLTTGNYGDDEIVTLCKGIRPRFSVAPSSSTLTAKQDYDNGDSFTDHMTVNLINGKYDFMCTTRWHRFTLEFNGDTEILGITPSLTPAGER